MTLLRALSAELGKAATLPGIWVGISVMVVASAALTAYNASMVRGALAAGRPEDTAFGSAFDAAFAAVPLGTVGAVVIGVLVIGTEYTANSPDAGGGRQITTTLTAVPHRVRALAAKALLVMLLVAAAAAVTLAGTVALAAVVIGGHATEVVAVDTALARSGGTTLYWILTALIAFAITVLARSAVIPLLILIVNSSLVSVSLLLTNLTPLAHWLPDLAGRRLFGLPEDFTVPGGLDLVPGAIVMGAWTLALLLIAGIVFHRRDA